MQGRTNAGGVGAAGGLNLQFVGSMTAPSNPKENMIWVKTDRAITQFLISKSIGAWSVIAGAVEMTYEASNDYTMTGISTLFFNGKLHGIYGQWWFKPTALYQSNGITAEPKDAYIYKSGTWVQFSWSVVYLYNSGDSCDAITGNWKSAATGAGGWGDGYVSNSNGTLNVGANDIRVTCAATNNKIDLSKFKTLTFVVSSASGMNNGWHRGVLLTSNSFNWNPDAGGVNGPWAASHTVNITGPGTFNIDISGENGALYAGVAMAYQSVVSISKIYLS